MKPSKTPAFTAKAFFRKAGPGKAILSYPKKHVVYGQGDVANTVFYIQKGKIQLTVVSEKGKEGVIGILGASDFVGIGCLAGRPTRLATAHAVADCSLVQIEKGAMLRLLRDEPALSECFTEHLLSRYIRLEGDLVDQLLNSAEKRLARVLVLLARLSRNGQSERVAPPLTQETLAKMIGATRERVNFLMNKFRKLGFIEYDGELLVHGSLLSVATP